MKIELKLFALARDLVGSDTLEVDLPDEGATVADLRQKVAEQQPRLAGLAAHAAMAVDMEYADDSVRLTPESDVACIPPVSGG